MTSPKQSFVAAHHVHDGKTHLLLAAGGSVAAIKIPNILRALAALPDLSIRLILTSSAMRFLQGQSSEQPSVESLTGIHNLDGIYSDVDEWDPVWTRGSSILHIELRRWADVLLIAPLSANGLAKIAGGLSDDLLTSVVRAWDTTGAIDSVRTSLSAGHSTMKRILVAPAMNSAMWSHPVTRKHLDVLENEWGFRGDAAGVSRGWFTVLQPQVKLLACGDAGNGAMMEWSDIVDYIKKEYSLGDTKV